MVEALGMSEAIGPRNVGGAGASTSPYARNSANPTDMGGILRKKVDDEVDRILTEQYERGTKILTDNMDVLSAIAKVLIEKEKINGLEMLQLIKGMKPELIPSSTMEKVEKFTALLNKGQDGAGTPAVQLAA